MKWYTGLSNICVLCGEINDSRDHLFFKFKYSSAVWIVVKKLCKLETCTNQWQDIENCVCQKRPNGNIWSVVQRLTWAASVYYVWNERNRRLFQNVKCNEDVVVKQIMKSDRERLINLHIASSFDVKRVKLLWGF